MTVKGERFLSQSSYSHTEPTVGRTFCSNTNQFTYGFGVFYNSEWGLWCSFQLIISEA